MILVIIRNCTRLLLKVAVGPSEYLRKTNVFDAQQSFLRMVVFLRYSEGPIALNLKLQVRLRIITDFKIVNQYFCKRNISMQISDETFSAAVSMVAEK